MTRLARHSRRAGQAQPDRRHAQPRGAARRDAAADHLHRCCSRTSSAARSPAARSTTTCSSCSPACSPRRSPSAASRSASTSTPTSRRASSTASAACRSPRSAPLVGAVLGDVVRYVAAVRRHARLRLRDRLPRPDRRPPRSLAACRARDRLRAVPVLDLGLRRHARPHARRGAGHPVPRAVPADVRRQHVRPGRHAARAGCRPSPTSTRSRTWSAPCAGCCSAASRRPTCSGRSAGWADCSPSSSRSRYAPTAGARDASAARSPRRGSAPRPRS